MITKLRDLDLDINLKKLPDGTILQYNYNIMDYVPIAVVNNASDENLAFLAGNTIVVRQDLA